MPQAFQKANKKIFTIILLSWFSLLTLLFVAFGNSISHFFAQNIFLTNYHLTIVIILVFVSILLIASNFVAYIVNKRTGQAAENIRKTDRLYRRILNGLNDGVWDYHVPTDRITFSGSYETLLGLDIKELDDDHEGFTRFIHPDDLPNLRESLNEYLNNPSGCYESIFRVQHKDGHWVWILSRGISVADTNGTIVRMTGTHTDITAHKQREEELKYFIQENELQRAELIKAKEIAEDASHAKGDFLAMMSHEIRTPMNAVIGLSSMLMKTDLGDKQKGMATMLYDNADLLLKLIDSLLDFSRLESRGVELELHSFYMDDVFKVLHTLFYAQIKTKGLKLNLINQIKTESYMGDATRLQQILVNLISNSLKFTSQGEITVVAEHDKDPWIRISIADTGVGISAEKLPLIFEKFTQADQTISRRFGGSGLGLSISKSLALLMGGDINVMSEIGKGSVFTLSIPLERSTVAKSVSALKSENVNSGGQDTCTVLLVEDYAANILVATLMLEDLGYHVDVATSGNEAIEKLEKRSMPYDVILMDVQMHGLNGYETTEIIRAMEKDTGFRQHIIGVTAHALMGDRDKCLAAGMDDYMSKPIHPDILKEKLMRVDRAS
jgi:two-component system, sensor histidine kinase